MQNVSYTCMKNDFDLHDNERTDQTLFVMNGFAKTRFDAEAWDSSKKAY